MLADTALKNLKPKAALSKVTDRDGMYVTVSPVGTVTFRSDYRMNGRRGAILDRRPQTLSASVLSTAAVPRSG
jgi:hypothetical protein